MLLNDIHCQNYENFFLFLLIFGMNDDKMTVDKSILRPNFKLITLFESEKPKTCGQKLKEMRNK